MAEDRSSTLKTDRNEAWAGRTVALVGLMGAGKTTVGRRLAKQLSLEFLDADAEIEKAAGCTIPQIFEKYGEEEFRKGERKVISRLLDGERRPGGLRGVLRR